MRKHHGCTLAPSDLSSLLRPSNDRRLTTPHRTERAIALARSNKACILGGRVQHATRTHLLLADALAVVTVLTEHPLPVAPGDLIELRVYWDATAPPATPWRVQELLTHVPCSEPRGDGEQFRLAGTRAAGIRARHRALAVIRDYFEHERFLEVETPSFVRCPGLDPHVHSLAEVRLPDGAYHLITSPEFAMKRLLSGGLPRIFQLARCFRADEHGRLHEPEFTLLEWYRAFASWGCMLEDTEAIVRAVFSALAPERAGLLLGDSPFESLTVRQAFHRWADEPDAVRLAARDPDRYFRLWVECIEPGLRGFERPVFITHYPLSQAALARPCAEDPSVVERFELHINGVELCNGFGELTDEKEQRIRFENELARRRDAGEPLYPIDERFLSALAEGMPPSAGNALGVDRLILLATGASHLSDVLCFSHTER